MRFHVHSPTAHWSYSPLILRPIGPTTQWSYNSQVLQPTGPTTHWSYSPLVLHLIIFIKVYCGVGYYYLQVFLRDIFWVKFCFQDNLFRQFKITTRFFTEVTNVLPPMKITILKMMIMKIFLNKH